MLYRCWQETQPINQTFILEVTCPLDKAPTWIDAAAVQPQKSSLRVRTNIGMAGMALS